MGPASIHVSLLLVAFFAVNVFSVSSPIASAAIMSTSGDISVIAPPASVESNALQADNTIFVFQEQNHLVLPVDTNADITAPGFYEELVDLTPGTVPMATLVNVHYGFFDALTEGTVSGSITFEFDVVGIALQSDNLDATDDALGAPGTAYPDSLPWDLFPHGAAGTPDDLTLSADRRTVILNAFVGGGQDRLRIITAIPEPSALTLAGLGLFGLLAYGWRRRRRA